MADKQVSTLGANVVTTVVTALAESLTAAKNSGTALQSFCTAAAKAKFPALPNEADVVAVVDALSAKLGWNGTAREKVSKSEARNIVRQHAKLPELMTALRTSAYGACGYHDAVKLCRLMKSEGNVSAAVAKFNEPSASKPVDTLARLTTALQAHYQSILEEKKGAEKTRKLAAMTALAEALGFDTVKANK
jgi:predicted trehalose synthase